MCAVLSINHVIAEISDVALVILCVKKQLYLIITFLQCVSYHFTLL